MLSAIGAHFMTDQDTKYPFTATEQKQAFDLWAFVSIKIPKFTNESALNVIQSISPLPGENPKQLAKRLKEEMKKYGMHLKHTNALNAASKILGHGSWHEANQDDGKYRLKVSGFSGSEQKLYSEWRDLSNTICDICTSWAVEHKSNVFMVTFEPTLIMISSRASSELWPVDKGDNIWPILAISPIGEDSEWLSGSASMLEKLRRHLEGTSKAILDGVAVPLFFDRYIKAYSATAPHVPTMQDVCNSELILLREDNELWPGYEIARGNEFNCWAQLELASKKNRENLESIILKDGAWIVGDARYVWQVSTLRPMEFVPGLITRQLGNDEVEKLLHRYQLVRKIFGGRLPHRQELKRLNYLGSFADTYHVDQHRILLELNKAGHTWETYMDSRAEEVTLSSHLPAGLVLGIVTDLKLENPNILFKRPNRSQMTKVIDDQLFRALFPRVDQVSYSLPHGIATELRNKAKEAIDDFVDNLRLLRLSSGDNPVINLEDPLPYLVYANDHENFIAGLQEIGLEIHAGVMPWLFSTTGILQQSDHSIPFAVGNTLYLEMDFAEAPNSKAA